MNPLELLDFYKTGHIHQYPPGTQMVYSNGTARSSKHFKWKLFQGKVVYWGLQGFIQEFLIDLWNNEFFKKDREECVKAFEGLMAECVDPNFTADHIRALHDLGYLPLHIRALAEGTLVPIGVPMFTIYNTRKEQAWLTNSLETLISTEFWKKVTTATIAFEYLRLCKEYAAKTCEDESHVPFQCHDFSMRGLGGVADNSPSGHLLSFLGTDTVPAIRHLKKYYKPSGLVGCSVPATEHSVMCFGGKDSEQATVERLLTEVYPSGIFSCVLDTWDFFKVLTVMLPALKEKILARDGKFVVRPDSGNPADIICGIEILRFGDHEDALSDFMLELPDSQGVYIFEFKGSYYRTSSYLAEEFVDEYGRDTYNGSSLTNPKEMVWGGRVGIWRPFEYKDTPENKGAIQLLWETFGGTINSKGYKVLNPKVGLIYGDSITLDVALDIFERLESQGFASSNVVLGVGSYTYQYVTRDTFGFAIKATAGQVNGEYIEVSKDPVTDDGTKKSLSGFVCVVPSGDTIKVIDGVSFEESQNGLLKTVFLDGKAYQTETLESIRERLNKAI